MPYSIDTINYYLIKLYNLLLMKLIGLHGFNIFDVYYYNFM